MVVGAVVGALLAAIAVAVWWRGVQDGDAARDCARAVAAREDNRAMWVWALTQAQDPTARRVIEAKRQLDARLPVLMCNDDHKPTPVTTED